MRARLKVRMDSFLSRGTSWGSPRNLYRSQPKGLHVLKKTLLKNHFWEKTAGESWWLNQPNVLNISQIYSNWIISPGSRGKNRKYLEPPPRSKKR